MAATHTRLGRTSLGPAIAELRRIRGEHSAAVAELAELRRLVAAHIAADPGLAVTLETARQWAAEAYARGLGAGLELGRLADAEPLDVSEPRPWPVQISPELDRLRYPPHGRARFGEPRPGDFAGTETDR